MSCKRPRSLEESAIEELIFASDSEESEIEQFEDFSDISSADSDDEPLTSATAPTASNIIWSKVKNILQPDPEKLKGVSDFIDNGRLNCGDLTAFQWFKKFFPDEIYDHVSKETNKYAKLTIARMQPLLAKSRFHKWCEVSPADMKAFIAVEIGMIIVQKSSLHSYRSHENFLVETPGFSSVFSRKDYELIRSFLHFADNNNNENDRLYKIRPIINITKNLYMDVYNASKEICVDESMLKFKGRLFFKQYLPSKPSAKWGIKLWSLCDSKTGYLLRFNVYTGKDSENTFDGGLGSHVVQTLLKDFENKGHVIFLDNFYSSVHLYEALRVKDIGACGTVRANRKGLPYDMKKMKAKRGDLPIIWVNEDKTMAASTMQDTGKVNMISTIGDCSISKVTINSKKGNREVVKPSFQMNYNAHMGGVDKFDQLCSTYPFNRRAKKWYQVIWHFIIEAALINSMICYNIDNPNKKLSQKKFRLEIINGLLDGYARKQRNKGPRTPLSNLQNRLVEKHFISKLLNVKSKPNCIVCSIMPSQCKLKGKGICKRKQTSYFCQACNGNPPLCIEPCFEVYHTKKVFKKVCAC